MFIYFKLHLFIYLFIDVLFDNYINPGHNHAMSLLSHKL